MYQIIDQIPETVSQSSPWESQTFLVRSTRVHGGRIYEVGQHSHFLL